MDAALLKAIQGGTGLRKVPDSEKNDRSAAQAGSVAGSNPPPKPAPAPNSQNPSNNRPAPSFGGQSGGMSMMDEIRLKQQRRAQGAGTSAGSASKFQSSPKPIPKNNITSPSLPVKTTSGSMPPVPKPPGPNFSSANMPPVPKPPSKMNGMPPVPRPPGPPNNMPPVPKPPAPSQNASIMPPVPKIPSFPNTKTHSSNPVTQVPPPRQPPPSVPPPNNSRGPPPTLPPTRPPIPSKAGRAGRNGKKPPPLPTNNNNNTVNDKTSKISQEFATRFKFSPIHDLPKPIPYDNSPKTPLHTQYQKKVNR